MEWKDIKDNNPDTFKRLVGVYYTVYKNWIIISVNLRLKLKKTKDKERKIDL